MNATTSRGGHLRPFVRPRVLLNCAATLDGRMGAADGGPLLISDHVDLKRVHAMRAACDAILVGVGTVLADDPSLRVKPELAGDDAHDPLRVILDSNLRTPPSARVLDGSAPTIVFHAPEANSGLPPGLTDAVPRGAGGGLDLAAVLQVLSDGGVESVMVEGGAKVLGAFIEAGLWDEWMLYQAPRVTGAGPSLPTFSANAVQLHSAVAQGEGVLWTFRPPSASKTDA